MKPMDDVWEDISSLPSLHHPPTTHHFQDFFAPAARPTIHHPSPPLSVPPLTTMLSLSTSGNSGHDQEPPHTNSIVVTSPNVIIVKQTSPPEYTEKFKRLMKNRESAARSRARKQARADELEHEVLRLMKENAKLKRLHKELCSTSTVQVPKNPRLHRSKSAPL
ncbi:uncharacterized protein LOC143610119 [Bidens hawaiensis]|uniref:uncharacterized protein LOC143610119 n=1 Tax=Bidens hawaiensis TaxID=980011 RepID=UPI004049141C